MTGCQQLFDERFDGRVAVSLRGGDELFDLVGTWGQTNQIEVDPTYKGLRTGRLRRNQPVCLQWSQDEQIDFVPDPGMIFDAGSGWPLNFPPGPML